MKGRNLSKPLSKPPALAQASASPVTVAEYRFKKYHVKNEYHRLTAMTSNIPETLLSPENTICDLQANSKKALLENIAKQIHKDVNSDDWESIFDALIAREKYGSTGFGNGIALPHCRLATCLQPTAFFTKLKSTIDFDSIDGEPVDLVFTLVVPENATDKHLEILAKLASILDKNAFRISLRDSQSDAELFKRISKMLANQEE